MREHRVPLLRIAVKLHNVLSHQPALAGTEAAPALDRLCQHLEELRAVRNQLARCQDRRWYAAAAELVRRLRGLLQSVEYDLPGCRTALEPPSEQRPSLRDLHAELLQTEQEFGTVEYHGADDAVVVTTEPITLESVRLGRFELQLSLERLGDGATLDALRIEALEPNTPHSDDRVTHPHVQDARLCAGDAAAAMHAALDSGRLGDFFMLARSVLTTYNAESPYVALDNWSGRDCHECGYTTSADELCCCAGCQNDVCDECIRICRGCDCTQCASCMTSCELCRQRSCEDCLESCSQCGSDRCASCLTDGHCPTCVSTTEEPPDARAPVPTARRTREQRVAQPAPI